MENLSLYVSDFIDYCKFRKALNGKTIKAYSTDLRQLLDSVGGALDKASICSYISHLHKVYKPKTAKRKLATLKAFIHYLLIEDIIDSGVTLSYLTKYLKGKGAKSVRTCTLLDKPSRRKVDFVPDYCGARIPDEFVVGYGLDYNERYRALPFVGVLHPSVYSGE